MKLLWIIFLSVFVALRIPHAQETPAPADPTDQAQAEDKESAALPSTTEGSPAPSPAAEGETALVEETKETPATPSPETTDKDLTEKEVPADVPSVSAEAPSPSPSEMEVPPETPVEDLPTSEADATGLESAASGPEVPVEAPDTSFIEPDSNLNFGEDHASAMDEAVLPPPSRNIAEEERQQRLHYQKARVQALKDPAVIKAKEAAEKAKTPEDYRANYRLYYNLLYDKIAKIDPRLQNYCFSMKAAHIHRLAQSRILPTIPNHPPPTPAPSQQN